MNNCTNNSKEARQQLACSAPADSWFLVLTENIIMASLMMLYLLRMEEIINTITDFFISFEHHQNDVQCSLTALAKNLK